MVKMELFIENLTEEGIGSIRAVFHGEEDELVKLTQKLMPLLSQFSRVQEKPEAEKKMESRQSITTIMRAVSGAQEQASQKTQVETQAVRIGDTEGKTEKKKIRTRFPRFVVCVDQGKVLLRMVLENGKSFAGFITDRLEAKNEIKNFIMKKEKTINTEQKFREIVNYLREKYGYRRQQTRC